MATYCQEEISSVSPSHLTFFLAGRCRQVFTLDDCPMCGLVQAVRIALNFTAFEAEDP